MVHIFQMGKLRLEQVYVHSSLSGLVHLYHAGTFDSPNHPANACDYHLLLEDRADKSLKKIILGMHSSGEMM